MNIGYLYGFNSYPPRGGASIHVYNLVKNLTELGYTIHTFNYERNPQCVTYPATRDGTQEFLKNIDLLYVRIDGSFLHERPVKIDCMERAASKPIVWEVNAAAEERLSRYRSSASFSDGHIGQSLLGKVKARISQKKKEFSLARSVWKDEQRRHKYAQLVDTAICVSDALKSYILKDLGIGRCKVIPNGTDPAVFSPDRRDDNLWKDYKDYFKVIYSGDSRWPWQRFDLLVKLAERSTRNKHKILFVVLTSTPSDSLKTQGNLLVLNSVKHDDVPAYLASADACLLMYDDFSWSKYGFHLSPIKLFEYMASGRPVIASRLGQVSTVIEDEKDGLLVSNGLDEIYEKILFCREYRDKAMQMGKAAREKIIRFYSWEHVATTTSEVFESARTR